MQPGVFFNGCFMEMSAFTFFLSSLAKFLLVVNPIFVLPTYLSLTGLASPEEKTSIAIKSCVFAFSLCVFFALFGEWFLGLMGISLNALRFGGGILLFFAGYSMISAVPEEEASSKAKASKDVAIFPLGFPMIAGPGGISILLTLMSEVPKEIPFQLSIVSVVGVVIGSVFLAMVTGQKIVKLLGKSGINIMQKVSGLLISFVSAQMVLAGAVGGTIECLKHFSVL